MCHDLNVLKGLCDNFFNYNLRELLTVTVQLAVTFSSLLVEYENLLALNELALHFGYYLSTLYCGSTYGDSTILLYQKNLLEFNRCTILNVLNVVNKQFLASLGLELLSVNFYNCVH